ncbi:MAG: anthranilate phosphoribosyltransferase [Nannocystaceae bacterium]|nr:anthranilate phosphoribosyltransferase [Nannocystaceae bacterium]
MTSASLSMNSTARQTPEAMRGGLAALARGRDLTRAVVEALFDELMAGRCDDAQIGALLMGLAQKGETIDEIVGAAAAMRRAVVPIQSRHTDLLDTCGTGGSGIARRNESTAVALCVAACGVRVAKHGNRGASSPSGSADVLEALGVNVAADPGQVGRCLDEVGVGFLFAPRLHPAMKYAVGPRRSLGIRTVFNLLGPLTNPAGATRQLLGVYDPRRLSDVARALGALGSHRVIAVHGFLAGQPADENAPPGIDDLSPEAQSLAVQWHAGEVTRHVLRPEDAGLSPAPLSQIAGGTPADNAAALTRLLDGEPGAYRMAVQYSGAMALVAAGEGDIGALREHAVTIGEALDSGRAKALLAGLIAKSHAQVGDA